MMTLSVNHREDASGQSICNTAYNAGSRVNHFCYNHRKAIFAAILIGATLYTGNMFHTNYKRALAQASVPSAPLERFRHFPTWMHTDPVQVLGFPAAVAPNLVPTKKDINRKEKQFRSKWSINKWPRNHFTSQKEAELAFTRGIDAYNILMKWYENPHCEVDTAPFRLRHQRKPRFVYNDSLPSLANPCRCTYPAYVVKQLKQIFVPVRLQPKATQTEDGLSSYCPCTKADATASWATFEKDVRPAHLARIIKAMPWFPMDYRVLWYTISGFNTPQYIPWDDFNSSEYEKCFVKNDLPGKEAICDWAVEGDIFPVKTDCENSSWKNQQKKLDEELESLRWSLSQGMHGMGWD